MTVLDMLAWAVIVVVGMGVLAVVIGRAISLGDSRDLTDRTEDTQ